MNAPRLALAIPALLLAALLPACGRAPDAPPAAPPADAPAPADPAFLAVPFDRLSATALFVDAPQDGAPTVRLVALRDSAGRPRIAFDTCQACAPSPRAYFLQAPDGRLVCQNCRNSFAPDALGTAAGGCNPMPVPGLRETPDAFLVPLVAIDAVRPAFARHPASP